MTDPTHDKVRRHDELSRATVRAIPERPSETRGGGHGRRSRRQRLAMITGSAAVGHRPVRSAANEWGGAPRAPQDLNHTPQRGRAGIPLFSPLRRASGFRQLTCEGVKRRQWHEL
jgi:hypothetical protein